MELVAITADAIASRTDTETVCMDSSKLHGRFPRLLLYSRRVWRVVVELTKAVIMFCKNFTFCMYILLKQVMLFVGCAAVRLCGCASGDSY